MRCCSFWYIWGSWIVPAITALRAGNDIAIANKEPLVIAGDFFIKETKINKTKFFLLTQNTIQYFNVLMKDRERKLII